MEKRTVEDKIPLLHMPGELSLDKVHESVLKSGDEAKQRGWTNLRLRLSLDLVFDDDASQPYPIALVELVGDRTETDDEARKRVRAHLDEQDRKAVEKFGRDLEWYRTSRKFGTVEESDVEVRFTCAHCRYCGAHRPVDEDDRGVYFRFVCSQCDLGRDHVPVMFYKGEEI